MIINFCKNASLQLQFSDSNFSIKPLGFLKNVLENFINYIC